MQQLFHRRYEKLKLLGRGTFGEVWKVKDRETDSLEALKIYDSADNLESDALKMIKHEFSLLVNVTHPNLLTPRHYAISSPEGFPYIVLKYCDRGNICQLVGKMDELKAWRLLHDMASALSCLHSQDPAIIHQDIKPENILMDGDRFMLSDFGVSTHAKATAIPAGDVEERLQSVGTIPYMPPEKFVKGSKPIMLNDVWSLGATLYEMLSGQPPFGNHGGQIQAADTTIPPLSDTYSAELRNTIYRCLAYKTADRPYADELKKKAEKALNNGGRINPETEPQKPEPTPEPPKPKPKAPWLAIAIAAAASLAIGSLLFLLT